MKVHLMAGIAAAIGLLLSPVAAAEARPYREVYRPAGKPAGTVLLLHGGGWLGGLDKVATVRDDARRYARWGWRVWNVDYRSGRASLIDARAWYRRLDRKTRKPTCVAGESAGGHLALMVAVEDDPDCIIATGAPTDLTDLSGYSERRARATFGDERRQYSPVYRTRDVFDRTRVLLGHAREDDYVPYDHATRFKRARSRRSQADVLPCCGAPFVHTEEGVDPESLQSYRQRERRVLRHAAR